MGGDRASGKCLGRRADFPLSNTLPHGKQSALSQDLRKSLACLFLPSFLFMGVKEGSAVMKTGMGCSPQKCEHSVLRMRVQVSNLHTYRSLEHNSVQILKLDILSQPPANFCISICKRNCILSQGFLKGKNLLVWIQDEERASVFLLLCFIGTVQCWVHSTGTLITLATRNEADPLFHLDTAFI